MERGEHSPLRFAPILLNRREDTQIVVRRVVVGIDGQKVIQMGTSFCVILLMNICFGKQLLGSRVPWLKGQCSLELPDGFAGLAEPEVAEPQIGMRFSVRRSLRECLLKFTRGLAVLAESLLVQAEVDPDVHNLR